MGDHVREKMELQDIYTAAKLADPSFEPPDGDPNWKWEGDKYVYDGGISFADGMLKYALPTMGIAAGGAGLMGLLGGGAGAATTAGMSIPGGVTSGLPAALGGAAAGGGAGIGAGGGIAGTVANVAGKAAGGGTDMKKLLTMLGIQAGSDLIGNLFGGDNGFDDPQKRLNGQFDAIKKLTDGLTGRMSQGYTPSPSSIPQTPKPISLPGLPFQIGGGMGMDPAIRDPKINHRAGLDIEGLLGPVQGTNTGARPRRPSGGE